MASCLSHPKARFGNDGTCSQCRSCKHPSLWRKAEEQVYRCVDCPKTSKENTSKKECWILTHGPKGVWVEEGEYLASQENVPLREEPVPVTQSVPLSNGGDVPLTKCQQCGEQFEAKRSTAKYCSERCKKSAQRT